MKHLISASVISMMLATPAMADLTLQLSDVKTKDITESYQLKKMKKGPSTRGE